MCNRLDTSCGDLRCVYVSREMNSKNTTTLEREMHTAHSRTRAPESRHAPRAQCSDTKHIQESYRQSVARKRPRRCGSNEPRAHLIAVRKVNSKAHNTLEH